MLLSSSIRTRLIACLAPLALTAHVRAALTYEVHFEQEAVRIAPGDAIEFPSLGSADSNSVEIRVLNLTQTAEQVSQITVAGAAFRLESALSLPVIVGPGGSIAFRIRFQPPAPGDFGGLLSIDGTELPLAGSKAAVLLSSSLRLEGQTIPLDGATRVSLPSVTAGGKLAFTVVVANLGGLPGEIRFLDLSGFGFSLLGAPPLPVTVEPGATFEIGGAVAPSAAGAAIGVLRINERSVQIETIATNPPQLSRVIIKNLPDPAPPLTQPLIGLEIPEPYPADLVGTLTLDFTSESFVNEPGIVFSTGTRQVDVRIPAGSTRARFGPGLETVALQTGTTRGVITLLVNLRAAGVNVTGGAPFEHTVRVIADRPTIHSLYLEPVGDRSFNLLISGFSTTRSLSTMDFEFAARPGVDLAEGKFRVDVARAFGSWYGSVGSHSFGSQFTASLRVTLSVETSALTSITVSAANELGQSEPKILGLR